MGLLPRLSNEFDAREVGTVRDRRALLRARSVYLYTHEVDERHFGLEGGWLGTGCPEGQPRSIQAPHQEGPRDRSSPEEGHPDRNAAEHRKAGEPETHIEKRIEPLRREFPNPTRADEARK